MTRSHIWCFCVCRQGAIQQRMLQMLTGGQSMPPASLAEAAAADVAAAAAQQQQQQSQQHPQQHSQQQLQVCAVFTDGSKPVLSWCWHDKVSADA